MGETLPPTSCPSPYAGDATAALSECAEASISLAEWALVFTAIALCGSLVACTLFAYWQETLYRHT
jgi:hypothetical protein